MNKFISPDRHFMNLKMQPDFPAEDLTKDNAHVLEHTLSNEPGFAAHVYERQARQQYIYQIANRAARLLGFDTRHSAPQLQAFSGGLSAIEAISDLVHPTLTLNDKRVIVFTEPLFVDTRSSFDVGIERAIFAPAERAEQLDTEPREIFTYESFVTAEEVATANAKTAAEAKARAEARARERENNNDTSKDQGEDADILPFPLRVDLTPTMEDALRHVPTVQAVENTVDQPDPEKILIECHKILPGQLPNTFDVIVAMSRAHRETKAQLQMRLAGAGLALLLQTHNQAN